MVAIVATVVMLSSMFLCACGAGIGFLGGAAKALMQRGKLGIVELARNLLFQTLLTPCS